jgi:hypothetical protein
MNRLIAILTLSALVVTVRAAEPVPNSLTEEEKKAGWKLLFDGKSLDGWLSWKNHKPLQKGGWSAEDGELRLSRGGGDIYTKDAYENFEWTLEYRSTGNSGIFIRVDPAVKGAIWTAAPEMQIDRKGGGYLYGLYPVQGKNPAKEGHWNRVVIRMEGGKGTHWLNGVKLYEYTVGSEDWESRVKKSKFQKHADVFGKKAKGHLGLQDHGAAVSFRNIKVRELSRPEKK